MSSEEQRDVFNEWLAAHRRLLFKIVRAYARTPMDRDDLFQEIAVQVWKSVPAFRHECAVTTWLYRIALNVSIRWITKLKREPLTDSLEYHGYLLEEPPEKDERLDWLYDQIAKLDEIDRSIMLMLLDELSYKEMAVILGISESNVGVKINRIKKRLSQESKKEEYGIR